LSDAIRRYFSGSPPTVVFHDEMRQQIERRGISQKARKTGQLKARLQNVADARRLPQA
jgi:hypothetical protein